MTPASMLTSFIGWPMSRHTIWLRLDLLHDLSRSGLGQPSMPVLLPGGAPLVYLRFVGPSTMQVGIYQGAATGKFFAAPATFGMRPGYLHRLQITNPPGHPGIELFPTLEVRGTLYLPPKLHAASYPAAVVFTAEEIDRVLKGVLLTKVIYLEDPEKAFAVNTSVDGPVELDAARGENPLVEALERGRPMVIVRLGSRQLEPAEMAQQTKPGLILAPDQQRLERPPVAPYLPFGCWPVFDPIAGPRPPQEECLRDGGDRGLKAGLDNEGKLHGLDPADTVAEYKDAGGKKQLTVSNQVCICVPRFGVIRSETCLAGYETLAGLGAGKISLGQQHLEAKTPSLATGQATPTLALGKRERPSGMIASQFPDRLVWLEVLTARDQYTETEITFLTTAPHQLTAEQRAELRKQIEVAYQLSVHENVQAAIGLEGPAVVGRTSETQLKASLQEARFHGLLQRED